MFLHGTDKQGKCVQWLPEVMTGCREKARLGDIGTLGFVLFRRETGGRLGNSGLHVELTAGQGFGQPVDAMFKLTHFRMSRFADADVQLPPGDFFNCQGNIPHLMR